MDIINLQKNILKLEELQLKELYKIIENNKEPHTVNTNGVYFNLKYINKETLNLIHNSVQYYLKDSTIIQPLNATQQNDDEIQSHIKSIEIKSYHDEDLQKEYDAFCIDKNSIEEDILSKQSTNSIGNQIKLSFSGNKNILYKKCKDSFRFINQDNDESISNVIELKIDNTVH